ncbi:SusC/RagA family TonB-linked outer membrane protein [Echinicola rosea]|uniref:SusC/RagA family TonB-linked outer membrane protein n=1 Tax=Echinicola rosea TaxID=1807691 RepID=A0ABQ1V7I0_9BACT|nr:SusC/RagA family TonB-linked outer membrane protein [Echinicola rosea]GGF42558.1 SusC/RagA family TonB-linked outer membrane protein [Echinicola rosea]
MKYQILLLLVWLSMGTGSLFGQTTEKFKVEGAVLDEHGLQGIPGASIILKETKKGTVSNEEGMFSFFAGEGKLHISVSMLGYEKREIEIDVPVSGPLKILLSEKSTELETAEVVSTGFQELSKERTTGSFSTLDDTEINRRVSTGVLDRLENMVPGLVVNRDIGVGESISIRGTGSLFAENSPLIVVDNMVFEGDPNNINPNDVASMTVLKDAAAASIWGARAGNGVIVITTKSGQFNQNTQVDFNANTTWVQQEDPFYRSQMPISDFVDVERYLFEDGFYDSRINSSSNSLVSPVVETLHAHREGLIGEAEMESRLAGFASSDVRDDLSEYIYRPAIRQQYSLAVRGGGEHSRYQYSMGYDHNRNGTVANKDSRLTFSAKQGWKLWKDRLDIGVGGYYVQNRSENGSPAIAMAGPYDRLADGAGNPLPVYRDYSARFKESLEGSGLLDWEYVPLDEIGMAPSIGKQQDLRFNVDIGIKLLPQLKGTVRYQYRNIQSTDRRVHPEESYLARDLVNQFTQIEGDGSLIRPVPVGGIMDRSASNGIGQDLRGQLDYHQLFGTDHRLTGLVGIEIRDFGTEGNGDRYYGYNDERGTDVPVDYANSYPRLHNGYNASIPYMASHTGTLDRFASVFGNAAYEYKGKYLLNGSVRKDASNLFGVDANQRGVPLWSAGLGWILSEEGFMQSNWLDFLKLRATYGYNGNIDKSVSAYTTGRFMAGAYNRLTGLPSVFIDNPPNPDLRWEKIRITNFGLDFASRGGTVSGSVEFYLKEGIDLIGTRPYPASSGIRTFRGNYADTRAHGLDIDLTSRNLGGKLKWSTTLLHTYVSEKVTGYEAEPTVNSLVSYGVSSSSPQPLEGYPLRGIFSYPWAGLDPDTGDPRGLLDGEPSTEYAEIIGSTATEDLVYHGPARPVHSGALRNDLSWKNLSLSVNITYRLGYYFKRPYVNYYQLLRGDITHGDYSNRWQQPGDEQFTDIPSMGESADYQRNRFYSQSSAIVEKGDHIRLQDIRLSYRMEPGNSYFSHLEIYTYANNLGIIWKASDRVKDPDFLDNRSLSSISLGLNVTF